MYVALALLLLFFNFSEDYYWSIISFFSIITLPILCCNLFIPFKYRLQDYYQIVTQNKRHRFIALCFCALIVLCGPLDILINGFKLLRPDTYADLHGVGRYIRHITILCWIFIPVAFVYLRSAGMKGIFIAYAILFPILIIDRNRLFISCWSLLFCIMLQYSLTESARVRARYRACLFLIVLICSFIFAAVGFFRSGSAFVVPSSGTHLIEGAFPLSDYFMELPGFIQQIVLYITTPIFNFLTVDIQGFTNPEFLNSQLSPFSRDNYNLYPYAPIPVPRFNVGTEFYPFLLYSGLQLVALAFIGMLVSFYLAVYLFKKYPNIFTLIIFIKISYGMLFMGFAPQFYILLNLMFFLLMLLLWGFSELCIACVNCSNNEPSFPARKWQDINL
ncbi:hypothetical protein [Legionella saoudiensis]|uniref:hypothetical protein n=1 Tax=Legionella saoudiensis TaxID=1750561 RepID=UPI000A96BC69|nr:hypothetical protein [Legionella saoudiensis]